jgi:hypothetical protein
VLYSRLFINNENFFFFIIIVSVRENQQCLMQIFSEIFHKILVRNLKEKSKYNLCMYEENKNRFFLFLSIYIFFFPIYTACG